MSRWVYFVVTLCLIQINQAVDKNDCGRLHRHDTFKCCKNLPEIPMTADVKECMKEFPMKEGPKEGHPPKADGNPPPPPPCDIDNCVGKRNGYINEAGKYVKEGLQAALDKSFKDLPQTKKDIEEHCINGDINNYAPEDFCDGIKVKHCIHDQFLKSCTSWDTEGKCPEIQKLLADCKSIV